MYQSGSIFPALTPLSSLTSYTGDVGHDSSSGDHTWTYSGQYHPDPGHYSYTPLTSVISSPSSSTFSDNSFQEMMSFETIPFKYSEHSSTVVDPALVSSYSEVKCQDSYNFDEHC